MLKGVGTDPNYTNNSQINLSNVFWRCSVGAISLFVPIGFVMVVGKSQQVGNIVLGFVMDWDNWRCMIQ